MSRPSTRKGILGVILLALFLLTAGLQGNVSRLTRQNDRACASNSNQIESGTLLQEVLDTYSAKRNAGMQATVIFPDGTLWHASSGFASRGKECPVSFNHHFGIGSVTKLYTAALVMRQVETGRFSLDDSISNWFDLPYAEHVTVRMALNHTSGILDYTGDPAFLLRYVGLPEKSWRPDELLEVIRHKSLQIPPGSWHDYSNSNYLLLGIILEQASGKSYTSLLREMMDELGLRDTFYLEYPDDILIANAYDQDLLHVGMPNLTGLRLSLHSGAYSAGGIVSTSSDTARFTRALFTGKIVSDESLAEMLTFVHAPDVDAPERIGYGLGVRQFIITNEEFTGHTGAIPGYSGVTAFGVDNGITITILSNLSVIEQEWLLTEILEAIKP
ncbi:MAG TPA: serine hydrolase domain-containing protein [Anaerolineales bacterium]|nr:serine hydrolase domain-containing protein [Anaerolineales bacterium]